MTATEITPRIEPDARVWLHGNWDDYERLLTMRGESAAVRITYIEGEIELMSPSTSHEWIKTMIARLLEAWADDCEVDINGFGSWTIKDKERERGLEPDECYILGGEKKARPDLAIEVVVTAGGIGKLEVYRGLGVPEVWFWRRGRIEVHVLQGDQYAASPQSLLLPRLDLALLARFVDHEQQPQSVREYRRVLRALRGAAPS